MESISRRDLLKTTGVVAAGAAVASMANVCTAQAATGPEFVAEVAQPAFLAAPAPIPTDQIAETRDYDVVVVGAGAAGVPAALSALEAGAKVALLQKEATAVSQGNSGTGIDLENSDPAGVEALVSLEMKENAYRPDRKMLANWAWNSGEAVKWVIAKAQEGGAQVIDQGNAQQGAIVEINGYKMNYVTSFFGPKPYNTGDGMIALAGVAEKEGAEIFYETPAQQLVCDNGKVTGVIAQDKDGKYIQFNAAKGVIVATGDYQNDLDMCSYYLPDLKNLERKQFNKTGDGHKMVVWAGGKIEDLNHTKMLHDFDAGPASMCDMPFMAVKDDGKRFCDESVKTRHGHIPNGNGIWEHPDFSQRTWLVWDETQNELIEGAGLIPEVFAADVLSFASIEELAAAIETPADTLAQTIENFNKFANEGVDWEFGRNPETMRAFDGKGYYAVRVKQAILNTQGGPERNGEAEVLDLDGNPIPHLYSAGELGGFTTCMYQGGANTSECYIFGHIAGANAAQAKDPLPAYTLAPAVESNPAHLGEENDLVLTEDEAGVDANGLLTGSSNSGMGGKVSVTVTLDADGKISKVEVTRESETEGIGSKAIEAMPAEFVGCSTAEEIDALDTVSGATVTSNALKEAVKAAMGL